MAELTSKAATLDRIEEERQFWEALLAEVGEGRMERPGVSGTPCAPTGSPSLVRPVTRKNE